MKVALYVHGFFPAHFHGTEAYTLAVAKQLASRGYQPIVVTATYPGEPAQSRFIVERSWEGIPVLSIDKNLVPNNSIRDTYHQPAMQSVHEDILRTIRPDIVHVCHLLNHTSALLDATNALGIPAIATFTDFFGFCFTSILEAADGTLCNGPNAKRQNCIACVIKQSVLPASHEPDWRTRVYPRIVPAAAKLLGAVSAATNYTFSINGFKPSDLIERPDVLARAMRVYRLALVPTLYLKQAYQQAGFSMPLVLSRFGVEIERMPKPDAQSIGQIRLGYIGQIARHKGVHILADAFRAAGRSNLTLKIWGSHKDNPNYFNHLKTTLEGLPAQFLGTFPLSEISEIFSTIDVLVIPSIWGENSPLILLQALASGTPVVISSVEGMTELVDEGVNSFSFPRGDTAALTTILRRLADCTELSAQMSKSTRYERTAAHMVDDVIKAYELALGREL